MRALVAHLAVPRQDGSRIDELVDTSAVTGWDVVIGLAVLALSIPLSSAVAWIVERVIRKSTMPDAIRQVVKRLARTIVIIICFAIAVSLMGASVQWFTIVVALIGLIAVLILRPLIENFSAGLLLEVRGSFGVDDESESNDHKGEVVVIKGRTTVLQTRDGRRVAIPSTDVLDNPIVIFSAFEKRRSSLTVEIEYRADLDDAVAAFIHPASRPTGSSTILLHPFAPGASGAVPASSSAVVARPAAHGRVPPPGSGGPEREGASRRGRDSDALRPSASSANPTSQTRRSRRTPIARRKLMGHLYLREDRTAKPKSASSAAGRIEISRSRSRPGSRADRRPRGLRKRVCRFRLVANDLVSYD